MKKKKLPSLKRLRNKLDFVFNTYIKLRDKKCILSGMTTNLHCSHYYDKKSNPFLRWDERNAHAMERKIHWMHHHGKAPDYALWMFLNHNNIFMKLLSTDAGKKIKYKREDYVRLIITYENKILLIKQPVL